jgi:hypothetical protein
MAIIIDPDNLRRSTQVATGTPDGEIFLNPTANPPTIELISTDDWGSSNLDPADGVEMQALYSKLKELWKSEADLIRYPFPMEAITSEQYEFINDWELADTNTASRTYIRRAGWSEKDDAGVTKQEFMGVITLGSFEVPASQTAYYAWATDTAKTDFTYPGPVNQAIQIYGNATHGNVDYRTEVLTVYIRPDTTGGSGSVVGYTFDQSTTTDIGALSVTYQAYRFPLSSTIDLNLSLTDVEISSLISSKSLSITWYGTNQASNTFLPFDLAGGPYNFRVIINGDGTVSTTQFYNFVQYQLRQDTDVDAGAGSENGFLTDALVAFVGSNLQTFAINSGTFGVAIDGFDTNFTNDISMRDNLNTLRSFPYVAAGKITFNANLVEDAAARYWMFFTTNPGGNFGTANAILVDDNTGTDITGDVHYQPATPATGPAAGISDGSATSGGFVMTVSTLGWTVDDLIGKVLVITSGINAGYYWITDNDATTITISSSKAFEATDAAMSWAIRNKNTSGEIGWDFDYTNNIQGGRTGGTNADVTVIGLGLNTAQYVATTGAIQQAVGQNFSLVAALERNFRDPT